MAEHVNAEARDAIGRRRSSRFFLYVHYMDVHDYELLREPYADKVREQDAAVGELLDWLDSRRLLEDAVIVFTADHGERLGEECVLRGFQSHLGNPSFETVLQIPLIVWPALPDLSEGFMRSEDIFDLVVGIAGGESSRAKDLEPDELLLTENIFLTYRKGRWKSLLERRTGTLTLLDLEKDPGEKFQPSRCPSGDRRGAPRAHRRAGRAPRDAAQTPARSSRRPTRNGCALWVTWMRSDGPAGSAS